MELQNIPDKPEPGYPMLSTHRLKKHRVAGTVAVCIAAAVLSGCKQTRTGGEMVMPEPPPEERALPGKIKMVQPPAPEKVDKPVAPVEVPRQLDGRMPAVKMPEKKPQE